MDPRPRSTAMQANTAAPRRRPPLRTASTRLRAASPDHSSHNRTLLRRLGRSGPRAVQLHWRNALVVNNLALVRMVAQRESRRTGQPFDDLCSVGYEGLVRAVDSFDTSRPVSLSTYAVPCVRGAMQMERRDRLQPLQTPRRLRELNQRADRWLEQRRSAGLPPLNLAAMATALGCTQAQLEEAGRVRRALQLSSLDAPLGSDGDEGAPLCRLDLLADPASTACDHAADQHDPQLAWLRRHLARLAPLDRQLLEGRWIDGLTWSDLARQLGLAPQHCRQRGGELLAQLQGEAHQSQSTIASTAARVV